MTANLPAFEGMLRNRGSKELFSRFAHFLHFDGRGTCHALRVFSAALSQKIGERYLRLVVHPLSHLRVHLADSVSHSRLKMFDTAHYRFWARPGRVMGWNDPTFSSLARPKRFSGSFQPTLAVGRNA